MEDIFAFVVLWGQIWAYLGLAIKVLYVIVSPLFAFSTLPRLDSNHLLAPCLPFSFIPSCKNQEACL